MLDFLNTAINTTTVSFTNAIVTVLVSFVLGLMISLTYIATAEKENYSQSFCYTLIIVPIVASIIIFMVGNNVAAAFSVGGAFTLTRFRSEPGSPKNIAYVFFTVAAGLACGVQCYAYAFMFTVVLCLIMFVFTKLNFGRRKESNKVLKILIPETLDFDGAFDEVFEKYTVKHDILKISTVDLGSLYEISYALIVKEDTEIKEFIDELRVRNGNLSISLTSGEYKASKAF
jgi:hypothetical protein